ncbi:hypothetical protein [Azospirillum sp. BE72]|uniref:hypothetical protein n=1 Tax=Azospirillum sp. BE72 TaxID=2817776 RepID=UPI00285AD057|nr:hypothetical protein [Azospirillum sp. BE72]MDR6770369.1 hypothetical protein [Azospirillum sp. BE72]
MTNRFSEQRDTLRTIRDAFGPCFSVSASLVGDLLTVSIAKPDTDKRPYCMTFDDEADYERDAEGLVSEFVTLARAYFGAPA